MPRTITVMDSVDSINAHLDALEAYRPAYVTEIMNSPAKTTQAPKPLAAPVERPKLQIHEYDYDTMEEYFQRLFKMGDADGNGVLDPAEVSVLLQLTGFNFDMADMTELISEADVNHDGVIEYSEFVPMMLKCLGFTAPVSEKLDFKNYNAQTLETYFRRLFQMGDADGNGVLDPKEVFDLLKMTGFQFSLSQINNMIAEADANHDGMIQYEEFVPMMLKCLGIK